MITIGKVSRLVDFNWSNVIWRQFVPLILCFLYCVSFGSSVFLSAHALSSSSLFLFTLSSYFFFSLLSCVLFSVSLLYCLFSLFSRLFVSSLFSCLSYAQALLSSSYRTSLHSRRCVRLSGSVSLLFCRLLLCFLTCLIWLLLNNKAFEIGPDILTIFETSVSDWFPFEPWSFSHLRPSMDTLTHNDSLDWNPPTHFTW